MASSSAIAQGLGSGDLGIPYYRADSGTWGYVFGDSWSGLQQSGTYLGSPLMLEQNAFDSSGNSGDGSLMAGVAYSDDYGVTWQDYSYHWPGAAQGVSQSLYMMWSFAGIDPDGWLYIFSKRWNGSHLNDGDLGAIQLFREFSVKLIGSTYCMSYFDVDAYTIQTRTAPRPDRIWTAPKTQITQPGCVRYSRIYSGAETGLGGPDSPGDAIDPSDEPRLAPAGQGRSAGRSPLIQTPSIHNDSGDCAAVTTVVTGS